MEDGGSSIRFTRGWKQSGPLLPTVAIRILVYIRGKRTVSPTNLTMSPMFISSLRHTSTPPIPAIPLTAEDARRLVVEASGITSYIPLELRRGMAAGFQTPSPIETMDSSDDDAPSDAQPRPARWTFPETPPISPAPGPMEQYICFVYRDDAVSHLCPVYRIC